MCDAVLLCCELIEQGETLLLWSFVQTNEMVLDTLEEVRSSSDPLQELAAPEQALNREAAKCCPLSDQTSALARIGVLLNELRVLLLLALRPDLMLGLTKSIQLYGHTLEIELGLLGLDHLGEVAVGVLMLDRTALKLARHDGGSTANRRRFMSGQIVSELALDIVVL